jgi:hypothetical protein
VGGALVRRVRARAIALLWAWQAILALVAAWPAATLVRAGCAGDPDGEAVLLRPEGHALLAFLARETNGVQGALGGGVVVLVVGAAASLLPTAMLLYAIEGGLSARALFSLKATVAPAVRGFPAFAILFVGFGLAQALVIGVGAFVAPLVANLTEGRVGEVRSEETAAVAVAVLVMAAGYLAVLHDVARAAVARRHKTALAALAAALETLQSHPWPLAWAWAWRSALSWLPLAAIAFAPWSAPTSARTHGAAAFVAWALLHQGAVILRIALRASWLAVAVRTVGATVRAVHDEPAAPAPL